MDVRIPNQGAPFRVLFGCVDDDVLYIDVDDVVVNKDQPSNYQYYQYVTCNQGRLIASDPWSPVIRARVLY